VWGLSISPARIIASVEKPHFSGHAEFACPGALRSVLSDIENQPIEEICGPDHLCLFYTSRAEQLAAVIPFIQTGLRRGERCVYIADENPGVMIEAFQAAGVSVEDAIRVGGLVILTKWDTYLRTGPFDPQAMLQYLQDQVGAATAAGFEALRVTGEVNWIQTTQDVTRFLEYEARLNDIVPQSGLLGMCQYHRDCVRLEMVLGILDTHPRIVEKEGVNQTWCS
jgi:chemotaxis family two-component system sensor kinase Cph1